MSFPPQAGTHEQQELPPEVAELERVVGALPLEFRARLYPLVLQVAEGTRRRRRILNLVQEALGQLRLDMKYLIFDLEATRRERDELLRRLEG